MSATKKKGRPPKAAKPVETFEESEAAQGVAFAGRNRDEPPQESAEEIESGFDLPVCPIPTDPACGDKTPAVVQWWKDNYPEEYRRRYANRTHPAPDDIAIRPAHIDQEDESLDDETVKRKPNVLKN